MFQGQYVRLRAFEPANVQSDALFVNHPETARLMYRGIPFPATMEDEMQFISSQSRLTRGEYQFAVETLSGEMVGRCGIASVDWKNRCAELNILIGHPFRQKGYGRDALSLLCRFCFDQMNLHRLKVSVLSSNTGAVRCYLSCGFEQEGCLRQEVFRDGTYLDVLLMGRLNDHDSYTQERSVPHA